MKKEVFRKWLVPLLLLLAIAGCRSAREELVERALGGDPFHQAVLADAYLNGYGFNVDRQLAAKWARSAADRHDPDGLYLYGTLVEAGLPAADHQLADKLYAEALPGLRQQADRGNPQSLYDLGNAYLYGRGVSRDYAAARVMFETAARRNFTPAETQLGLIFLRGWGVKADRQQAKKLLLSSALNGIPEAQTLLGDCYRTEGNYTAARNWYREAAARNYPPALTQLAVMARDGLATQPDLSAAADWFERAGDYPPALTQLADLKRRDPATRDQALQLYLTAIGKDYAPACLGLAELYAELGKDNPDYVLKAMVLYRIADNLGVHPDRADRAEQLDSRNALFYFVRYGCQDLKQPSYYLQYQSIMPTLIAIYRNGQEAEAHRRFQQALQQNPLPFYYGNAWVEIYRHHLPLSWAGEIFQAAAAARQDTRPFFWLGYGTCANLAGRPELAMLAVSRLDRLIPQMDSPGEINTWKTLVAMIRTEALIQRGLSDKAYSLLESDADLRITPPAINFIAAFCPALFQERNRYEALPQFRALSTLSSSGPAGAKPAAQPFFDYARGAITLPQAIVPEPEVRKEPLFIPTNL